MRRGGGDFMVACLMDACVSFSIQMTIQALTDFYQLTAYQSIVTEFCLTLIVAFVVNQVKERKNVAVQQAQKSDRQD